MNPTASGTGPPAPTDEPAHDQAPGAPGGPAGDGSEAPPAGGRPSRRALLAGALGFVAAGAAATGIVVHERRAPSGATSTSSASATQSPGGAPTWTSGASGAGAADGTFAAWRGHPLGVASTWADNDEGMVMIPQLQSGAEFSAWTAPLDIAIGAIGDGETWAKAAAGAYEDRWAQSLGQLKTSWGSRSAQLYVRFAHEMNGNWYDWKVDSGSASAFTASWKRFRALQQSIFPAAKLVFCVNRESSGGGADWRRYFPGRDEVDVFGVDYYNQYPYVATTAQWDASMTLKDAFGAPKGLEAHRLHAKEVGLPLALPEWSGNATMGDSPVFIQEMHTFFAAHGGDGPGELLYEVLFNADNDDGAFQLFADDVRMPESAKEYRRLF